LLPVSPRQPYENLPLGGVLQKNIIDNYWGALLGVATFILTILIVGIALILKVQSMSEEELAGKGTAAPLLRKPVSTGEPDKKPTGE
jgi:hypothetical protein